MFRIEDISKYPLRAVSEIAEILDAKRKPVNATERAKRQGPYPYYGANGQVGTIDDYIFDDELVLVAEDGGFFFDDFKPISYRVSGKCWVNNHAHILKAKDGIETEWLNYSLCLQDIRHLVNGATRPKLTQRDLIKIKIPFPPLKEQRRIVARIRECLSRVEEMERLQAVVAKDQNEITLKFLEEEYDRLCSENRTKPLSECADVMGGGTPNRQTGSFWGGGIPWVSPKDMKRWEIESSQETITDEGVKGSSVRMIDSDAVLFVVRGMILLHTVPVAISRVPLTINQDMKALLPRKGYSAEYLAFMLKAASPKLLRKVNIAGHGTRRLNTEDWIDLPIPDVGTSQSTIVERLERFRSAAQELLAAQRKLDTSALRNAILRQAFAGEL